jgi:hypothetical protein
MELLALTARWEGGCTKKLMLVSKLHFLFVSRWTLRRQPLSQTLWEACVEVVEAEGEHVEGVVVAEGAEASQF